MTSDQNPELYRYRIFVYGTLRPGGYYFERICRGYALTHQPAWTRGKLYHLPMGYPAMCQGDEKVYGDLLCFNSTRLKNALDQLEGYQADRAPEFNEYNLKQINAWLPSQETLPEVWAYLMEPGKIIKLEGTHLPNGQWPSPPQNPLFDRQPR